MRLVSATLYAIKIPFSESIKHSLKERSYADSVIVRVVDEQGTEGFGEGAGRAYVTGETPAWVLEHIADRLWPEIANKEIPALDGSLEPLDGLFPSFGDITNAGIISYNASRAALELAVVDVLLRRARRSLSSCLPPKRSEVLYSGLIPGGSLEKMAARTELMKHAGLKKVKIKVGMEGDDDVERVRIVREIVGPGVSIRLDANCAWNVDQAVEILGKIARYDIAAVEQPIPRGPVAELKRLKERCSIPLMVDESLVTVADGEELIAAKAADYFNIRVSKCGGLIRSLRLARLAREAGVGIAIGCQVGETAILSAAGRFLAASLEDVTFVDGWVPRKLLADDVADYAIPGERGAAPLPSGLGLGVDVDEAKVSRLATSVFTVN